jgi:hypothetical protein
MKAIKGLAYMCRKKIFVLPAMILCLSFSIGHASASQYRFNIFHLALPVAVSSATGWVLDKTVGNVDFYHSIIICNGKKSVFLKFNNKNNHAVKITWKEVFKTPTEETKDGYMGKKEMVLSSGITEPNDCADAGNKKSIILPSEVDPMAVIEILDFSFKEITVNTL